MSAVMRPKRNAFPGEWVSYYPTGDPSEEPVPMLVYRVDRDMVSGIYWRLGHPLPIEVHYVHHLHSEHWDAYTDAAVLQTERRRSGAYDLHPIYGPLGTRVLSMATARAAKGAAEDADE